MIVHQKRIKYSNDFVLSREGIYLCAGNQCAGGKIMYTFVSGSTIHNWNLPNLPDLRVKDLV